VAPTVVMMFGGWSTRRAICQQVLLRRDLIATILQESCRQPGSAKKGKGPFPLRYYFRAIAHAFCFMVELCAEAGFVNFEIEAKGNGRYPTRDAAGLSGGSHHGYVLGPCGPLSAKRTRRSGGKSSVASLTTEPQREGEG
jgi:hypothetical protein